ncbi:hypothetical protein [Actinomadura rayongensis]|uniref:Uncharacterized protein n=1 Tax=Actinomadura rayongensis TaxID=1429076 RepID=A0A6I4W6I9_9ACTN|nr:hypothetical protein [Actinomadura rayongensis]MXQ63816.1 hypothetical protein [Actinomadura rayongensis]
MVETSPRGAVRALLIQLVTALAFTAFAVATTQVDAVRAGSPWRDDPYTGVVAFTQFLVPVLVALAGARALLRSGDPRPGARLRQLVRAGIVASALAGATVAVDWIAVALRADRALWNGVTPWLVAALAVLSALVVAGVVAGLRVPDGPDDGDWLDDLPALTALVAPRVPRVLRAPVVGLGRPGALRFVRAHAAGLAVAAGFAGGLAAATAQAVGEHGTTPVLFLTFVAIGTGGFSGAALLVNRVLRLVRPTAPARRAPAVAAVAALLALPGAAVLRDPLRAAAGLHGPVDTPAQLAAVTVVGAACAGVLAFAAASVLPRAGRRA